MGRARGKLYIVCVRVRCTTTRLDERLVKMGAAHARVEYHAKPGRPLSLSGARARDSSMFPVVDFVAVRHCSARGARTSSD